LSNLAPAGFDGPNAAARGFAGWADPIKGAGKKAKG
jgi:hypothetical protein